MPARPRATYVTADELVEAEAFGQGDEARYVFWERAQTTGVVHAPCGAHPTSCAPLYGFDVKHLKEYAASAKEPGAGRSTASATSPAARKNTCGVSAVRRW